MPTSALALAGLIEAPPGLWMTPGVLTGVAGRSGRGATLGMIPVTLGFG